MQLQKPRLGFSKATHALIAQHHFALKYCVMKGKIRRVHLEGTGKQSENIEKCGNTNMPIHGLL
jgi:hypothetical protein